MEMILDTNVVMKWTEAWFRVQVIDWWINTAFCFLGLAAILIIIVKIVVDIWRQRK